MLILRALLTENRNKVWWFSLHKVSFQAKIVNNLILATVSGLSKSFSKFLDVLGLNTRLFNMWSF